MRPLWPHQERAYGELRAAVRSGSKRPMLQAPTGSGKTLLAAWIIHYARQKGNRVVFVVPALSLIDQTVTAFWNEGIQDVGVMQAAHVMTNPNRPVQVASAQTLGRRERPEADLVIVDEAHELHSSVKAWMAERPDLLFIGLSATPWARGLAKHFDRLIIAATLAELIEEQRLSPFRVFAPTHPDLSKVRVVAGEYHEGDLSDAMQPLVGDVITTWLERGEGRPTLCFGVDRDHASVLQKRFQAAGVPAGYIDMNTTTTERRAIADAFHRGELKVVCNVGCLTKGVDWDVRCVILARPTKSEALYVQIIGRGLRTAAGKADCLILDHSDTTLELGFVTDIHHDKLDDGKPKKASAAKSRERKPRECSQCSFVRPPAVQRCPACGFEPEHKPQEKLVVDGHLIEMDSRTRAKLNKDAGWLEKQAFIAELRLHAKLTTKKEAWVAHKYREKFGVWPNDARVRDVQPSARVSDVTRNWIRAQAIRYARSKPENRPQP